MNEPLTLQEKMLYHQIHPLKLSVDIGTSLVTTYFAWQHNVPGFLILFLIPSVIATMVLLKFANLDQYKRSAFGTYLEKYMTRSIEGVRFTGQIMMWVAAWFHIPSIIALGVLIIIGGWLNGFLFKRQP